MDRLQLLDAGLRAFDASLPDVVPPLCLVTRYRASSCRRCLDVCPNDAIECSPWLRVEPERCTSCGACAAVCPTGALDFGAGSAALRERLAETAATGHGRVVVACRYVAGDEGGKDGGGIGKGGVDNATVVVPCLGALAATDLIGAAAAGTRHVTLVSAGCEGCRQRRAVCALDAALETAAATLYALGRRLTVERRDGARGAGREAATGPGVSRRGLFAFVARGARRTAAEGLAGDRRTIADLHGQAPPRAGHARLRADLGVLAAGADPPVDTRLPAALPFARVEVTAACNACGLCVRYCPHGALAVADGALRCDESRCTACGLCVAVCPPDALGLSPATIGSLPALGAAVP